MNIWYDRPQKLFTLLAKPITTLTAVAGYSGKCVRQMKENMQYKVVVVRCNLIKRDGDVFDINLGEAMMLLTGPSVTRFTHNRCIAVSGSGTPESVAKSIAHISPILHEIKKQINACMLA